MDKIKDPDLKALAQGGHVTEARLKAVDEGMTCELAVTVKGEAHERVLHARRGGVRTMQAQTALQYARDALGLQSINVKLKPER